MNDMGKPHVIGFENNWQQQKFEGISLQNGYMELNGNFEAFLFRVQYFLNT